MTEKLKKAFDSMVVYKDLAKTNFFTALSLPSFLRDWLLQRFEDENGEYKIEELAEFIQEYLPRREQWTGIKDRVVSDSERVKFLAKIVIDINIKTSEKTFALPDYGLTHSDTIIEDQVWDDCRAELATGKEVWGVVEIGYRRPAEPKEKGKIKLVSFQNFCPYTIDLDYYKEARKQFSVEEWIDVVLGAIDYNAAGYVKVGKDGKPIKDENGKTIPDPAAKLNMLKRLLPFVEKRLNLVELAPPGTAKSYLFGQVSKYGWLTTGGSMTRAKMFYDIAKRTTGLVSGNDYVALDEIGKMQFPDAAEMASALQGYMEQGVFKVGNFSGVADAGVVILGNIDEKYMNEFESMFVQLPSVFHDRAIVDRFHGFIKGWEIPRMTDDMKARGWALNSEYFCTIMHLLRDEGLYRAVVDALIEVPKGADTRDTEAVKRLSAAYLKLLFPHVKSPEDIEIRDFVNYCLRPSTKMRSIIKYQMGLLDPRFKGKNIPTFKIKEQYAEKDKTADNG